MKTLPLSVISILSSALFIVPSSFGQTLYSDNFDVDSTANWTINGGPSDEAANFYFDYSTVGIPSAPNSGGSTRGVKLQANQSSGIFGGVSVSPVGQSFSGNYQLRLDMWLSYNGPAPVGGSGSTQVGGAGFGTAGTTAQWPGGTQDSVWFAATGDGNSSSDYRAYSSVAPTSYADTSGVYAAGNLAGSRNGSHAYYAGFGNVAAPAAQLALFSQQTGNTGVGSLGWAWHDVSILKTGNTITWSIDGLLIATVDASTATLGGGNILLTYSDTNAGSSTDPEDANLLFGLYDNVRVSLVPEPSIGAMIGVGLTVLAGFARNRRV